MTEGSTCLLHDKLGRRVFQPRALSSLGWRDWRAHHITGRSQRAPTVLATGTGPARPDPGLHITGQACRPRERGSTTHSAGGKRQARAGGRGEGAAGVLWAGTRHLSRVFEPNGPWAHVRPPPGSSVHFITGAHACYITSLCLLFASVGQASARITASLPWTLFTSCPSLYQCTLFYLLGSARGCPGST